MGFFSGMFNKAKAWVSETKEKIVKKAKEVVSNTWNGFTGKNKFDEADELYEEINLRYSNRKRKFDKEIDSIISSIKSDLTQITDNKDYITSELFSKMGKSLSKIKDVKLPEGFTLDTFETDVLSVDSIRDKSELYTIDFNNNKFKTNFIAIMSLGFATRKKAKETLLAVKEEEKKIEAEIAKMNTETSKMVAIKTAFSNVAHTFDTMIELYQRQLIRLDDCVNHMTFKCVVLSKKVTKGNLSIKMLPLSLRKELEGVITATKILSDMIKRSYTMSSKNYVAIEKDAKEYSEQLYKMVA